MSPERWELHLGDEGYPECLYECARPPRRLYGIGKPELLDRGLGIVGARKATPYGLTCAKRLGGWAAQRGVLIVSGGAIGCDQEAHRAALAIDAPTVAVLGCGADVDYPRGADKLLSRIRETGACISEYPWETHPTRWAFVERNRLIAAFSSALLVVEAGLPSGTFTTADFALEMGREVLAVPGSIFAPECRGSNRLVRQGATPITDVSELASALESCGLIAPSDAGLLGAWEPSHPSAPGKEVLDRTTRRVLSAVRTDPGRPDDIARDLDIDIVTLIRALGALETLGYIARYPGGRYGPRA